MEATNDKALKLGLEYFDWQHPKSLIRYMQIFHFLKESK